VLTSFSKFESQTQIPNSHSQSIAKLEVQLGQLAKSFNEREIGKCSSPPVINPRSGGVIIDPKVGKTKTEPIGQLEKTKLAKGKGVFIEAPHSTTKFLEAQRRSGFICTVRIYCWNNTQVKHKLYVYNPGDSQRRPCFLERECSGKHQWEYFHWCFAMLMKPQSLKRVLMVSELFPVSIVFVSLAQKNCIRT
jgi:hypothetical protein